jgi:hypothetical protein
MDYVLPTRPQIEEVGERPDEATYMRRIENALQSERDVRFRVVDTLTLPLELGEDDVSGFVQSAYIPSQNMIAQTPAATYPDPEHLQVLVHEGVHALLHSQECFPPSRNRQIPQKAEAYGEAEAEAATIAVMAELGEPLDVFERERVNAGTYTIDWDKVRRELGEDAERRIRWATEWLVTAAQGGKPQGTCPPAPSRPAAPLDFQPEGVASTRFAR